MKRYSKPIAKKLESILDDFELETDRTRRKRFNNNHLTTSSAPKRLAGEERSSTGDSQLSFVELHELSLSVMEALSLDGAGRVVPFIDEETIRPCVIYHHEGWTYGVIRLNRMESK